ncbi:MAG TPA: hypothetical protein PL000_20065, partial [Anaerolineales bacterium]|nr:hypothetical protein [Anaerolineales bacterium]
DNKNYVSSPIRKAGKVYCIGVLEPCLFTLSAPNEQKQFWGSLKPLDLGCLEIYQSSNLPAN